MTTRIPRRHHASEPLLDCFKHHGWNQCQRRITSRHQQQPISSQTHTVNRELWQEHFICLRHPQLSCTGQNLVRPKCSRSKTALNHPENQFGVTRTRQKRHRICPIAFVTRSVSVYTPWRLQYWKCGINDIMHGKFVNNIADEVGLSPCSAAV